MAPPGPLFTQASALKKENKMYQRIAMYGNADEILTDHELLFLQTTRDGIYLRVCEHRLYTA